ncbi:MAG: DUF4381 domain-containing protein [Gammaproteobacteria bacterium]|jgi:hypothetical protein|nr:DUF4381 domain-containing protein [Xanthomonadales bacterium]
MNSTAPALQLRDIHLPQEPGFWPLAPGWWVLLVLFLISLYFVIKWFVARNKQNRLIQVLQNSLNDSRNRFDQHKNKHQLASEISVLLKRFVKHVLGDTQAASLSGQSWISYLNQYSESLVFDQYYNELCEAQYSPKADYDVSGLIAVVKNFFPQALKHQKKLNKKTKVKNV